MLIHYCYRFTRLWAGRCQQKALVIYYAHTILLQIYKAVGWKVLAVGVLGYGGLYAFERVRWTTKAKERSFKAQYVDYAGSKLKLIVDLTSSNCSHQVQQ